MKTLALLPAVCGTLCLFTACEVGEDYGGSRVSSLTVDAPEDYYGDYDEYTPYYSYEGRRYYRHGGRYVYYSGRRPYYVATLPGAAVYITPRRTSAAVTVTGRDYYGDYDEYTPYYSYEGRRYYRHGGRYVYYSDRRPSYVATLPARATYITPSRRGVKTTTVITRHHRDDDDDDDRDDRD